MSDFTHSDTFNQFPQRRPTSSYQWRALLAIFGLLAFFVFYLALASWFTFVTIRLLRGVFVGGNGAVAGFFAAIPAAFFSFFLWKALFFIRRNKDQVGIEVKQADQPELFDYLHRLADTVGAPRVYRVFVSPEVNARVTYDLSILNFLFPAKKNLVIGLGLVNKLNRSEFTAVLAHEFGHFAQRSMALGRWVYTGEQIAAHIIAKRDFIDRILDFLVTFDLRLAWIGWIMKAIVWAIRSVVEAVFRLVVLAHLALSREMEFQADQVAVTLTGSDSLIHALYRLQAADEDWRQTLEFMNDLVREGKKLPDPYAIQSRIGNHLRVMTGEFQRGESPKPTRGLIFEEHIAQPPRMWLSHPSNTERELRAKQDYVPSRDDNREAWTLFRDPQSIRCDMANFLYGSIQFNEAPTEIRKEESIALLDDAYEIPIHDPRYRGLYINRRLSLAAPSATDLYGPLVPSDEIEKGLNDLYDDRIYDTVKRWRSLELEIVLFESLRQGFLEAPAGIIRHRGKTLKRSQLNETIEQVKNERDEKLNQIEEHDRRCRSLHLSVARYIGQGWQDYLQSLIHLLHFFEHATADVLDAWGHFNNEIVLQTATGYLWGSGRRKLVRAAGDLHVALARADKTASMISLPRIILEDRKKDSWRDAVTEYTLPPPSAENLHQWAPAIASWTTHMIQELETFRKSVLNELLRSEEFVAEHRKRSNEAGVAPKAAELPADYQKRLRGKERVRTEKLSWWSRFVTGDGWFPALARTVVTSAIVAAVASLGLFVGGSDLVIYNGLATRITVSVNEKEFEMGPHQSRKVSLGTALSGKIASRTSDGYPIDEFSPALGRGFATYVYNVGGAASLIEWTATYGNAQPVPPRLQGNPSWLISSARHVFTKPPQQISINRGASATRTVLEALPASEPSSHVAVASQNGQADQMIRAHILWDDSTSETILDWLGLAANREDRNQLIEQRLKRFSNDVPAWRFKMDFGTDQEKDAARSEIMQSAAMYPEDADWQYLRIRAMRDGDEQDELFIEASLKWPDNKWLVNAAGYSYSRQVKLQEALECFQKLSFTPSSVRMLAAVEYARLKRFLDQNANTNLSQLPIQRIIQFDKGIGVIGTELESIYHLHHNNYDTAWSKATELNDVAAKVLVACSVGAKPEWEEEVLKITPEEIQSEWLVCYLAALSKRKGKSWTPYLEHHTLQSRRKSLLTKLAYWLGPQGEEKDFTQSEDFQGLDHKERGYLIQSMWICSSDLIDDKLKLAAQTLLFTFERPNLQQTAP